MGEVRYSVNGKYFRDWNVYVSDSEGLFDALKRKKVNSYQWAEYHGQSVDLSNPKYEAREITLKCFVVGDNWVAMKANFDALVSEFQKSGTQRLLIEPFGLKPLPYEVYMEDSSELQKTFREGKMVGVFSLKLIEPNPIKKVLYFTGSSLNLTYNSPKETEIFYGNGLKETASGNVSLSGKTLANRVMSGYGFEGRNYYPDGDFSKGTNHYAGGNNLKSFGILSTDFDGVPLPWNGSKVFSIYTDVAGDTYANLSSLSKVDPGDYMLSFYYKSAGSINGNSSYLYINGIPFILDFPFYIDSNWHKVELPVNIASKSEVEFRMGFNCYAPAWMNVTRIKFEKGATATPYSAAPEEEKIIIIAGNVDEITGLKTNAEVLWEKL